MTRFTCIVLSLLSATLASQAAAQVNPQFADINDDIEMVRSMVRLERKAIVEEEMGLLPAESQGFWPIYAEYEVERSRAIDRKVKLITDYAAAYPDLGDELAKSLVADFFAVEKDVLSVREKYVRRFGKILAPQRVARFVQIESKLDAVQNLGLAEQIPLAN